MGPANRRGGSAAGERARRRLPHPACCWTRTPAPRASGGRGHRGGGAGGAARENRGPIPGRRGSRGGAKEPAAGGRGPRRGRRASGGWGARLGCLRGWGPGRTRPPGSEGGGGRAGVRGRGADYRARGIKGAGGGARSGVPVRGGPRAPPGRGRGLLREAGTRGGGGWDWVPGGGEGVSQAGGEGPGA